jgi:hypothetical protein
MRIHADPDTDPKPCLRAHVLLTEGLVARLVVGHLHLVLLDNVVAHRRKVEGDVLVADLAPEQIKIDDSFTLWRKGLKNKTPFGCSSTSAWNTDPHVFGPPGTGSISQRYGSDSDTDSFLFS